MGTLIDQIHGNHGDGYDFLRHYSPVEKPDVDDSTVKLASILHKFLYDIGGSYTPTQDVLQRGIRKIMQEIYVPGGDVETAKRLAEANADLAMEVARLKALLEQQERDLLRYDRCFDAIRKSVDECEGEDT